MPSPEVLEAYIYKITIQPEAVEVALKLAPKPGNDPSTASQEIVSLPWVRKPLVATKGVVPVGAAGPVLTDSRTLLSAIGKARHWVKDLAAGGSLPDIAKREGRGERQIRALVPLAFVSPATIKGLIDGSVPVSTVTELSRRVPLMWPVRNLDASA
jgi:hypothetical protein